MSGGGIQPLFGHRKLLQAAAQRRGVSGLMRPHGLFADAGADADAETLALTLTQTLALDADAGPDAERGR